MKSVEELESYLTTPSAALNEDMKAIDGDIMILGAGGKMGPTIAKLAMRAMHEAGLSHDVYAVSRFSSGDVREDLEASGVRTLSCDLLDDDQLESLPNVRNVIYMVGYKFGSTDNLHMAWAMNTYLPGQVAKKFRASRIVSFSTGNVYHLSPVVHGGSTEESTPQPVGDYAQSCLGRERIFDYFSGKYGTEVLHFRLNYAIDLRYGVLVDIAQAVWEGRAVDLTMGSANVIWQGDANERALRSLLHCSNPPRVLNVTGPETVSVRFAAEEFARRFGKQANFIHEESSDALLSNAANSHQLFGYPRMTLGDMMDLIARWIADGLPLLRKPTHFGEREGRF